MIKLLKKYGADINHKYEDGCADIHRITLIGASNVKKLIKYGADVNAKDSYGKTAFFYLPYSRQLGRDEVEKVVKILKKQGADINESTSMALWETTPLMGAVINDDVGNVEILIQNGADIEGGREMLEPPLHMAARRGYFEMVKLLIKYGAKTETKTNNCPSECPNECLGTTPLYAAACCGKSTTLTAHNEDEYLKIIKLLIEAGAKVNVTDTHGNTPLLRAVRANCKEIVELLIENGALIDVVNSNKETPMSIAKEQGNIEIQKILENALVHQKQAN